ncbi:P-loop containing nucleoside triphosphate hydrolase protein [Hesseltinella vesiculosa]|uniref:P-loop containing nucleoside triphosphate hydrolase protein n=1 Tax=Hesseltinella vesiculosa TaxID=101127 RepID=A0A1X2G5K0_9FUNG|nr:P-loop containing nucleoside triphosphate hydrolase protein [Hesseltinella vesiculosa]
MHSFNPLVKVFDNDESAAAASMTLSNRQKFKQVSPPASLYDRLERLGFDQLRRTKRFKKLKQKQYEKAKKDEKYEQRQKSDVHYKLPHLTFYAGAKAASSFPADTLLEVGFVGRSNVGKSSLLNALAETTIVRTSDKPGLTQQLNFYSAGSKFMLVDMPGYGFAHAEEEERESWLELIDTYINERKALKRIYVVIDGRHGLKVADLEFLKELDKKRVKFQVVLTKCDLVVLPTLARRLMVVENDIRSYRHAVRDVLAVSSKSQAGINQMRKEMLSLTGHLHPAKDKPSRDKEHE